MALAACSPATAGVNVFIGSPTIPAMAANAAVAAFPADATGTILGPVVSGGTSATANMWVNTTAGASPSRCSTPCAFSASGAYGSFSAAYTAASTGDVINVVDGVGGDDYGAQFIGTGQGAGTKAVTFQAATTKPEVGVLSVGASNVTVKNLILEDRGFPATDPCDGIGSNGVLVGCGTSDTYDGVVIDGLNNPGTSGPTAAGCPNHGLREGGDNMVFRNGEVRNIRDAKGMEIGGQNQSIENTYFHDVNVYNFCYSDIHNECVYASATNGLTLRNNRFVGCPTQSVLITHWAGPATVSDVTVEGNDFGHSSAGPGTWHGGCSFVVQSVAVSSMPRFKFDFNTLETCASFDVPASGTSPISSNVGNWDCMTGATFSNNVGATCGGSNEFSVSPASSEATTGATSPTTVGAQGWCEGSGNASNMHLTSSSPARGRGNATLAPLVDRDSVTRGATPDAGAYQYTGSC